MSTSLISSNYPPHIDITCAPLAYGDRALPRLNRELQFPDLIARQRAVRALADYLKDPEHIVSALEIGIVDTLKYSLQDEDVTVRQKATECFYIMAQTSIGREALIALNVVLPISALFNDLEDIVRVNAHLAIEMLCEVPFGAEALVSTGHLIAKLVEKVDHENDSLKEIILDTLHFCMKIDTEQVLQSDALENFNGLLFHNSEVIRAKAARNIMDNTVPLAGKEKAVDLQCVVTLVGLLRDPHADVRANASAAIATIAVTTKGKYTAIDSMAIPELLPLVDDINSEVRANALKALTCLSEAPIGRRALLESVEKIKEREHDPLPAVRKAAQIAVKVITWKP